MRTSRLRSKKFKYNFEKSQTAIFIIILSMVLGTVSGAFLANTINENQYNQISVFLDEYINNFENYESSKADLFNECVLKYGKTVFIIWVLSFIYAGIFFIPLVIYTKGLCIGFTSSVIIKKFGLNGIKYCIALYLPQNIILIPVYLCLAFFCVQYIFKNSETKNKLWSLELKTLLALMAGALLFVVIASLLEIFVTPVFTNFIK